MDDKVTKRRGTTPDARVSASNGSRRRIAPDAQFLRSILDSTTDGFGRWRIPSGSPDFGDRWLKSMGYSRSNLKTQTFVKELIHPDDAVLLESQIHALLSGEGLAILCDLRFRAKSGEYRRFEMRGNPMRRDRRGKPIELAVTICDTAGRKERDKTFPSRELLSAILDADDDFVFVVDPLTFRLVTFNKTFESLVLRARGVSVRPGLRAEEIVPDRASAWNLLFRQILEKGEAEQEYEIPAIGETYRLIALPLVISGQVSGICVFGRDITTQRQVEEAWRKSEEKFSKAFREGPISLTLTSIRDHRYLDVNEAFLAATGHAREDVIGKTPFDIDLFADSQDRLQFVQELMSTGVLRNREFSFRTKTGEVRHGFGSATIIEIAGEPCMLAVTHDITDRKNTTKALEESEERLGLAIESGHMYAFEWDPSSDSVQRSKESERILALSGGRQHTKRELLDLLLPEDREHYLQTLRSLTPERPSFRAAFRVRRPNGNLLWLEKSGRAFFHPDGRMAKVVGIATDVTEAHESERKLRELSGRLISTQEEERRRIARELHDHIGQELALLCVQAQRVASGKSDPKSFEANEMYKRAKSIATDVSKLSHRLHSTELDFLGLAVAAERLCRDFGNQHGTVMDFVSRNMPSKLDINKTRCLYRVLQEALQNVAKHSQASRVRVELEAAGGQLTLVVADNGIGIDSEKIGFQSGLGLVSIRERLHLVEGHFTLTSHPESGTILAANVPI